MNVGEKISQLIGTYKSKRKLMPSGPMKVYSGVISVETVIADLEQLKDLPTIEYSRKVKIPRFVADWIDNHFNGRLTSKWDKADLIRNQDQYISEFGSTALQDWISDSDNFLKFVDAVSYDFEVEEEPKYYVKVGDKLYFKNWGEDGTCPAFEIDDVPGGVTGITPVDLQEAEMTADIIGGTVEEVTNG